MESKTSIPILYYVYIYYIPVVLDWNPHFCQAFFMMDSPCSKMLRCRRLPVAFLAARDHQKPCLGVAWTVVGQLEQWLPRFSTDFFGGFNFQTDKKMMGTPFPMWNHANSFAIMGIYIYINLCKTEQHITVLNNPIPLYNISHLEETTIKSKR